MRLLILLIEFLNRSQGGLDLRIEILRKAGFSEKVSNRDDQELALKF